jgi:hypothetical protein
MYKSSHINRETGGGVKKSGTSPGIGGHGRLYSTVGLNGILLRNEIVQGTTNNTHYVMGQSCPVTAAQYKTMDEMYAFENANNLYAAPLYNYTYTPIPQLPDTVKPIVKTTVNDANIADFIPIPLPIPLYTEGNNETTTLRGSV